MFIFSLDLCRPQVAREGKENKVEAVEKEVEVEEEEKEIKSFLILRRKIEKNWKIESMM